MKRLTVVVSLLLVVTAASAQDVRTPKTHRFVARTNAGAHVGLFAPPRDPDDTLFVADTGPDLDTECVYRDHGPLIIHVPVKRYVGNDIGGEVTAGLLSGKARLILPAWDVDIQETRIPNERDEVYFNDHFVGILDGHGGQWKLNTFEIPINWLNFPSAPGSPEPAPADNIVKIVIDTNVQNVWCTAVDWVELEFKAIAPVLLVHGTNASSSSWGGSFVSYLINSGMPWSNDINLEPNGPISGNGSMLAGRVSTIAHRFGAKKVNIVAHSKGGLDTRSFLNLGYDPDDVKVASVFTLSTPHHGTIVSDIVVAARRAANPISNDADIRGVIAGDLQWFTPAEPAISEQRTEAMANFNRAYPGIPGGIKFYNYGADADLDGNRRIQGAETAEFFPSFLPDFLASPSATAVYRAIGNVASIRVTSVTSPPEWGSRAFTDIEVAQTNNPFALNDLVVSAASAHAPTGVYVETEDANHSSIKTGAMANKIIQKILSDYPNSFQP